MEEINIAGTFIFAGATFLFLIIGALSSVVDNIETMKEKAFLKRIHTYVILIGFMVVGIGLMVARAI